MGTALAGQTVVLIGGSAGIGLETARQARAEGAEVVLAARNPERLEQAAKDVGARSTAAFDATDAAALAKFFDGLTAPIDHVLVTGPGPDYVPLLEMSPDDFRHAVADHMLLGLEVARNAAPKMRPGGTLLLMGGTGGRRIVPGVYSAVTAALGPFAASLALELAPVRVNVIAAGFVDTPLSAKLLGGDLDDATRRAPRDASDRPCRRARRRGCAGRPHHGQHGDHRRHLRHRRRAAIRPVSWTPSTD